MTCLDLFTVFLIVRKVFKLKKKKHPLTRYRGYNQLGMSEHLKEKEEGT